MRRGTGEFGRGEGTEALFFKYGYALEKNKKMKKLWGFFSSMGLTVVLALLICAVAVVGSLITISSPSVMSYLDHRVLIYGLAELSGRAEVYWIFVLIVLIALFALNTVVCTINKVEAIIRKKMAWQRLIPHIVHLGFFIALTGHLLGSLAGFKSSGNVVFKGELSPVAAVKGLYVRLDDFTARNDAFGYRDYMKTTLTLFTDGVKTVTGDIFVNHPLLYKGMAFYYNDDGKSPSGIRVLRGGRVEELSFSSEASSGKAGSLRVAGLYPDFAIDRQGRPFSRSENFSNPYAAITIGGESAYLSLGRGGGGKEGGAVRINGEEIRFMGYVLSPYVVLSINKDPGIWVVVTGSVILLLGMVLLLIFGVDKRELIGGMRRREGLGDKGGG